MYALPSGAFVERIARSAMGGGVERGARGGGALAATGLRPAQPVTKIASANNKTARDICPAFRGEFTSGPRSCRRFFLVRRSASGTPCFEPARRFGQLL